MESIINPRTKLVFLHCYSLLLFLFFFVVYGLMFDTHCHFFLLSYDLSLHIKYNISDAYSHTPQGRVKVGNNIIYFDKKVAYDWINTKMGIGFPITNVCIFVVQVSTGGRTFFRLFCDWSKYKGGAVLTKYWEQSSMTGGGSLD